jgi:NAD(P)-dependent dehydrogenase (short-subunit alcohol dehydrogenase family)
VNDLAPLTLLSCIEERFQMKTLEGKVAIVTGGSSGLGAAAALQFAREGARVVIAARRNDKSEAVVRQIEELGSEGLFLQTDVSKPADVEALVEGLRGQQRRYRGPSASASGGD